MAGKSPNIAKIKDQLVRDIVPRAFWSYEPIDPADIPDAKLIEKVLRYGNDEQRDQLKLIYPLELMRQVWESKLIIQGQNLQDLNRKIAIQVFSIHNPDSHILKAYRKYNLYDRYSA